MNALLRKEWHQVRVNVATTLVALSALWLALFDDETLLLPELGDDDALALIAGLGLVAGLQLGSAQFAAEARWKTRDLLLHRSTGPSGAFRAKCLVGMASTSAFALVPALVWAAVRALTSPWAEAGIWSRVGSAVLVGTLAWPAWSAAALCCQLRHGRGSRSVATILGGASLYGAAAIASSALAEAPPWADAFFPAACGLAAWGLAAATSSAFRRGLDEDLPLATRPGIAVALGVVAALGLPLALVGLSVSDFARDQLRDRAPYLATDAKGAIGRVEWDVDWDSGARLRGLDADWRPTGAVGSIGRPRADQAAQERWQMVFSRDWERWGWPEPQSGMTLVHRRKAFALGGTWVEADQRPFISWSRAGFRGEPQLFYEARGNGYVALEWRGDRPIRRTVESPFRGSHVRVWGTDGERSPSNLAVDPSTLRMFALEARGDTFQWVERTLPDGDRPIRLERAVNRACAEAGYVPPFRYENWVLVRGERSLYEWSAGQLRPVPAAALESAVAESEAPNARKYTVRYTHYDGLDPTVEVWDRSGVQELFAGSLVRPSLRSNAMKGLAYLGSLWHTPLASLASFAATRPWKLPRPLRSAALLGGRRPWLLAANLGLACYLAWCVRRETQAWRRSQGLGRFWVAAVLLLGFPGWILFRFCEPRPAPALEGASRPNDAAVLPPLRRPELA